MAVGAATVILTVAVVVAVARGAAAVVAMAMGVAPDQLQAIMAAQLMAPMAEVMDTAMLLAMGLVMAQFMVAPCMVVHTVPTVHMVVPMEAVPTEVVPMEVVRMVHLEATAV